eukprot:CAMPEP_0168547434 /NCGR_PEP_ID=MMETSP0413-20121227/4033_1 /TAXON_ID=136452 /ORGANISM="Filamoeba nolandi, Strain NC-AS-23-1" /LENGTH=519 /DNA_ID=CAMNT_0008577685 /DNA_START=358 /DNA_END=1917 /DNA_ORIENTATION=-
MRWNDWELLQYNPLLAGNGALISMAFEVQSPVNGRIISWLWDDSVAQACNNSFSSIRAPKHTELSGFDSVVSATSVSTNKISFAPYQFLKDSTATNLLLPNLFLFPEGDPENNTLTNETVYNQVNQNSPFQMNTWRDEHKMFAAAVQTNTSWPLYVTSYAVYDDQGLYCHENTLLSRFMYWVFGNHLLYNQTELRGFINMNNTLYDEMKEQMLKAECSGDKMLVYTNLSETTRSSAIFSISVIFTFGYLVMTLAAWIMNHMKTSIAVILNNFLVVTGLCLSMVSFVLWWYSPDADYLCISRTWTLGLGFINVNASIFGYVFAVQAIFKKLEKEAPLTTKLVTIWEAAAAYFALNIIEIILLLLWQFIEEPHSEMVVVDAIQWQTEYTCEEKHGIMFLIQLIYFCFVCIWGCYVLYNFLFQSPQEDFRLLIYALHGELYLLVPLMIILQIVSLDDDQLFGIVVMFFLFLNGIVISAFFLPRLFKGLAHHMSSHSSKKNQTTTATWSQNASQLQEMSSSQF